MILLLKGFLAVLTGAGITLVYFYLYNKTIKISRRLGPGAGQAVVFFSYFGRLAVVGALLAASAFLAKLDGFLTAISFLVIYTIGLLFTQGRAGLALLRGPLSDRKE